MQKIYSRINWENFPSEKTAVNEYNLNKMDLGLDNLDDRIIALDAAKFNTETANTLIKDWVIDEQTGVITITKLNGEKIIFDLNIEKIPVNFTLSDDGIITMTTDDGEQFTANIGAMIPILTFEDSDEIAVSVSGEGVNKTYSFSVKNGSITEEKLNPTYLGEIHTQVARAESSATSADASEKNAASSSALAKSYAVGGTGTREGEDTDNARYYMEQAKAVSAVDIATTEKAGIVKPDGTTITADEDGTLHGVAKITVDTALSSTSTNPVQNKVVTSNLTDLRKETTVNLLNPTLQTSEKNGVTCINNGDGTYTFNGTATKDVFFDIDKNILINKGTEYKAVCFKDEDYIPNKIMSCVRRVDITNEYVYNNGSFVSDTKNCWLWIKIAKNVTVSNLVAKPMITTNLSATYDDFVPYTGNTGRLNGDVAELNKTVDTLKKSVSDGKTKVANAITDKGVETATDATFDVMAENISKIETGGGELHGATLAVSTSDNELFGQTVTLTLNGGSVGTTVFANNGTCSFVVQNPGTYIITCGEAHKDATVTSDNVLYKTIISVNLSLLKIVTFADGTDEEIAKMIQAHYDNKINIADYWAVGDTRSVSLSAMSATGVGESHRAQTVQFVIGDFEHDDLATPINGHTKAAVTLLQKDCLMDASNASNPVNGGGNTENGYMSSSNTNVGGWKNCARRTWCNNLFFAALPSAWQSMVKTVNKKVSVGNTQSTIETVQDKIFLAAEIEIFGSTTHSFAGEGTQYTYYKNATANRYKMPKWNSSNVSSAYFERSPSTGSTFYFCIAGGDGVAYDSNANNALGVAPCLCI